jgi:hypothetical protein
MIHEFLGLNGAKISISRIDPPIFIRKVINICAFFVYNPKKLMEANNQHSTGTGNYKDD